MKHERIIDALDRLSRTVSMFEGFVSDIKNGSDRPLNEAVVSDKKSISMCEFLNGDGEDSVNSINGRVESSLGLMKEMFSNDAGKDKAINSN